MFDEENNWQYPDFDELFDVIVPSAHSLLDLSKYSRRDIKNLAERDALSGVSAPDEISGKKWKQRVYNRRYNRTLDEAARQEHDRALKRAAVEELQTGVPTGAFKRYEAESIDKMAPFAFGVASSVGAPFFLGTGAKMLSSAGPYLAKGIETAGEFAMPSTFLKGVGSYLPWAAKGLGAISPYSDAAALAYWSDLAANEGRNAWSEGRRGEAAAYAGLGAMPLLMPFIGRSMRSVGKQRPFNPEEFADMGLEAERADGVVARANEASRAASEAEAARNAVEAEDVARLSTNTSPVLSSVDENHRNVARAYRRSILRGENGSPIELSNDTDILGLSDRNIDSIGSELAYGSSDLNWGFSESDPEYLNMDRIRGNIEEIRNRRRQNLSDAYERYFDSLSDDDLMRSSGYDAVNDRNMPQQNINVGLSSGTTSKYDIADRIFKSKARERFGRIPGTDIGISPDMDISSLTTGQISELRSHLNNLGYRGRRALGFKDSESRLFDRRLTYAENHGGKDPYKVWNDAVSTDPASVVNDARNNFYFDWFNLLGDFVSKNGHESEILKAAEKLGKDNAESISGTEELIYRYMSLLSEEAGNGRYFTGRAGSLGSGKAYEAKRNNPDKFYEAYAKGAGRALNERIGGIDFTDIDDVDGLLKIQKYIRDNHLISETTPMPLDVEHMLYQASGDQALKMDAARKALSFVEDQPSGTMNHEYNTSVDSTPMRPKAAAVNYGEGPGQTTVHFVKRRDGSIDYTRTNSMGEEAFSIDSNGVVDMSNFPKGYIKRFVDKNFDPSSISFTPEEIAILENDPYGNNNPELYEKWNRIADLVDRAALGKMLDAQGRLERSIRASGIPGMENYEVPKARLDDPYYPNPAKRRFERYYQPAYYYPKMSIWKHKYGGTLLRKYEDGGPYGNGDIMWNPSGYLYKYDKQALPPEMYNRIPLKNPNPEKYSEDDGIVGFYNINDQVVNGGARLYKEISDHFKYLNDTELKKSDPALYNNLVNYYRFYKNNDTGEVFGKTRYADPYLNLDNYTEISYDDVRKMMPKRDYIGGEGYRLNAAKRIPGFIEKISDRARAYGINPNLLLHRILKEGFIDQQVGRYNSVDSTVQNGFWPKLWDYEYSGFRSFGLDDAGSNLLSGKYSLIDPSVSWSDIDESNEHGRWVKSVTGDLKSMIEIKAAEMAYRQRELAKRGITGDAYTNAAYNGGLNWDKLNDADYIKRNYSVPDYGVFGNGGDIHIKDSKKGTFTAAAKKHGKSVQAFASQVLANKGNYSPAMVKKANFARNAAKWHAEGGSLEKALGEGRIDIILAAINNIKNKKI